jgi:hypothetical protein
VKVVSRSSSVPGLRSAVGAWRRLPPSAAMVSKVRFARAESDSPAATCSHEALPEPRHDPAGSLRRIAVASATGGGALNATMSCRCRWRASDCRRESRRFSSERRSWRKSMRNNHRFVDETWSPVVLAITASLLNRY